MNWLIDAFFSAFFLWVPLWVWVVLIIAGVIVVYRVFGWQATLAAVVAGLVFLASAFGTRRGSEIEKAKQQRADQKARDTITRTREDVADDTDPELDARLGRWTKEPK